MNFGVLTYVLLVTSSPVAPGTTVGKTCFSNPKCDEHRTSLLLSFPLYTNRLSTTTLTKLMSSFSFPLDTGTLTMRTQYQTLRPAATP